MQLRLGVVDRRLGHLCPPVHSLCQHGPAATSVHTLVIPIPTSTDIGRQLQPDQ